MGCPLPASVQQSGVGLVQAQTRTALSKSLPSGIRKCPALYPSPCWVHSNFPICMQGLGAGSPGLPLAAGTSSWKDASRWGWRHPDGGVGGRCPQCVQVLDSQQHGPCPPKTKGCPVNLNQATGFGGGGVLRAPNQEGTPGGSTVLPEGQRDQRALCSCFPEVKAQGQTQL